MGTPVILSACRTAGGKFCGSLEGFSAHELGGVIALGHPSGATGAKILATLVHALATEDKQFGLVTLCVGGGQGVAMAVERMR